MKSARRYPSGVSWLRFFALLIAIAAVAGACGGSPAPEAGNDAPPNPVTGVVTDVESAGIGDVESFTLTVRGRSYEFHIAEDVEYSFELGHLQEHRTSAEPVIVEHEEREDGRRYALSIEDA